MTAEKKKEENSGNNKEVSGNAVALFKQRLNESVTNLDGIIQDPYATSTARRRAEDMKAKAVECLHDISEAEKISNQNEDAMYEAMERCGKRIRDMPGQGDSNLIDEIDRYFEELKKETRA